MPRLRLTNVFDLDDSRTPKRAEDAAAPLCITGQGTSRQRIYWPTRLPKFFSRPSTMIAVWSFVGGFLCHKFCALLAVWLHGD